MNAELIKKIDEMIAADRAGIAADTIKLVNINSIKASPAPGAPFGEGVKKVLDTVMEMGKERGFETRDYELGVVSVAMGKGDIDLGIWAHGDVVSVGDGWNYDPFNAIEYKGCIIGRGATDNKGQLVAILRLMSIFKELGIELKYNPALYVGGNEETGMADMVGDPEIPGAEGFLNKYKAPKLSLVPDSGFPVGYGGKGGMNIKLISQTPWENIKFEAGKESSPGRAEAFLKADNLPEMENCTVEKGEVTRIFAETPPIHSASPKAEGNMITLLTDALIKSGVLSENDQKKAEFLRTASLDVKGEFFGIARAVTGMTPLSFALMNVTEQDGKAVMGINIRYPSGTYEEICEQIDKVAKEYGFEFLEGKSGTKPYLLDPEWDVIRELTAISNEVTGNESKPYTLSGGTYAHRLPNALVFGMNGCLPPDDFKKGFGNAHGIDECVSLDRLQRAMRIYARALLKLNEMEW